MSQLCIHRININNYMRPIAPFCNVRKGYLLNDDAESQMTIGYISSLSFPSANIALSNHISIANRENPTLTEKVCAVPSWIVWDGKPESPISFSGTLSFENKAMLCEALSFLTENRLCAEWVIYEYDYQEKKYFKYFYTEIPVQLTFNKDSRLEADGLNAYLKTLVVFDFTFSSLTADHSQIQKIGLAFRANGKQFIRQVGGPL